MRLLVGLSTWVAFAGAGLSASPARHRLITDCRTILACAQVPSSTGSSGTQEAFGADGKLDPATLSRRCNDELGAEVVGAKSSCVHLSDVLLPCIANT